MFGPLKYILYLFVIATIAYVGLYMLPSFIAVEQIDKVELIDLPKPQLVEKPLEIAPAQGAGEETPSE